MPANIELSGIEIRLVTEMGRERVLKSYVDSVRQMKNVGVKTKETVNENTNQADNVSPEQYAADKVSEAMKSGAESAAVGTEKAARKGVGKAKEKIKDKMAEKKEKANSVNPADADPTKDGQADNNALTADDKKPSSPKEESTQPKSSGRTEKATESAKYQPDKKTAQTKADKGDTKAVKEKQDIPAVKEKTQAPPKVKQQTETTIEEIKKPRQRKQSAPKTKGKPTVKKINVDKQGIRTLGADAHKVKQLEKSTAKSASKIKKADKAVKTADKSVKTAKNTVKTSTDVAKKTAQAAKATVKVTVKAVKATAKAVVEAGKAIAAAVKELGALIVAGGVPAIVIVVVICLIGAIGGACFGIFLANDETTGTKKTMSQAISELTSEHYSNLTAMKASYTYDLIEIQGDSDFVGTDIFSWPLSINGTITSRFGTRVDPISGVVKTHGGTDIAAPEGTPILAAADGTVVASTYNAGGYGFYVKIMHNGTYSTLCGHCSALLVSAGQTVKQGQVIAKVGSTGYSTGPHLHFEVIQNGVRVDALGFYQ